MPRLIPPTLPLSPLSLSLRCRCTTVSPSAPPCSPPSLLERMIPSFPHLPVVATAAAATTELSALPDLCGTGGTMETREIHGAQIRPTSSVPTAAMVDRGGAFASPTASIPRAWEVIRPLRCGGATLEHGKSFGLCGAGERREPREIQQHANQTGSAARHTGDLSAAAPEDPSATAQGDPSAVDMEVEAPPEDASARPRRGELLHRSVTVLAGGR